MCSGCAGDVLENFADAYPLAVGARGALLRLACLLVPYTASSISSGFRGVGGSVGVTPSPRHDVDDFFLIGKEEGEWRRRQGR